LPPASWNASTKSVIPALSAGRLDGELPWRPIEPDMSMTKLKSAESQTSLDTGGLAVPLAMLR
jgi:hypothetical protein